MYGRNPFEDDEDDYSFASIAKKTKAVEPSGGTNKPFKSSSNPFDEEDNDRYGSGKNNRQPPPLVQDSKQMQIQNSMNRQLESTHRCLANIYESEQIGISTAEELVQQGEKLDNVEKNVDKIIADTKTSQKHLNSIKSVFGGLKNWWNGDNKKSSNTTNANVYTRDRTNTLLDKALSASNSGRDDNLAAKSRGYDVKGFYDSDIVDFKDYDHDNFTRSSSQTGISKSYQQQQPQLQGQPSKSTAFQEYDEKFNKNLDLMANGLQSLKSLGLGLHEEITAQNEQLERITNKVDTSDTKIRNQNMQMKHILGK